MTAVVLGIDIGGTNTVFGLIDAKGNILKSATLKTGAFFAPETFVESIVEKSHSLFEKDYLLQGVGIGCPNANPFHGTMDNPPNLPLKGHIPLKELFESSFQVPCLVNNDAKAAAIGELYFGGAQGMKDFLMITLGTGVGSGFVCNGQLVYGHDGYAGEIGHTIIEPEGRLCTCGRKGCLERYTSAIGMRLTYQECCEKHGIPFDENTDAHRIFQDALKGEIAALEALDKTAQHLGLALANAALLTSPQAIFLFGGPLHAGEQFLAPIRRYFEANLLPSFQQKIELRISELMDKNAAILGASAMIWNLPDVAANRDK